MIILKTITQYKSTAETNGPKIMEKTGMNSLINKGYTEKGFSKIRLKNTSKSS